MKFLNLFSLCSTAPPSYEECVFGTNNLRDHGESEKMIGAGVNFAPKYPVYSFKST